jgi:hypothetical protein
MLLISCDEMTSSDDESQMDISLKLSDNSSDEGGLEFDTAKCKVDSKTGGGTVEFTHSDTKARFMLRLKGAQKDKKTYTCKQASDNREKGEVGMEFNDCGVVIKVPGSGDKTNTYASFRTDAKLSSFTHSGECTVEVSGLDKDNIEGEIACDGLVQTHYEGSPRNPIDSTTPTITVSGKFSCK